jgi:hypothetical protein
MVFDNLLRFKEAEQTPSPNIIMERLTWEYVTEKISNAFFDYKSTLLLEKKKVEERRIQKVEELLSRKRNRDKK